jgi:hypothetical protein
MWRIMDLSLHRHEVARALSDVETRLDQLVAALAHAVASIEIECGNDAQSPVRRACEAYSAINYRMEDAVGESAVCVGVIGVGPEILLLAQAVNVAKAEFKQICTPLQGIRVRIPVKHGVSPTEAIPAIRVILRNIQRSDVNLLAAYRKTPILTTPPDAITFTRANTRSVYRKTIQEIDTMLSNLGGPTALADRNRLATLDRRELYLALAKERYENIRANVLYTHLDPRGRGRIQIAAELPLLYPIRRRISPPKVRFPSAPGEAPPSRKRLPKLQKHPFLQSLPVFRYTTPA